MKHKVYKITYMATGKFYIGVTKATLEKRLKKEVLIKANKAVEKAKLLMLAEFDNHPITKEIKSGPRTNNSSGTTISPAVINFLLD